jgi:hypothetical protein
VVSCPAEKTLVATRTTSPTSGMVPSGKDVVTRLAPAVFDVGREHLVEVFQRRLVHRLVGVAHRAAVCAARQPLEKLGAILVRHTQQVGDDSQGEGTGEALDELALARSQEVVEDVVGELPHRVLVLFEALGCDQPHQQCTVVGVRRRVESRQLVAERDLVTMLHDQVGDVVAFERHWKTWERSGHRDAGRERVGVVVDVDGLLPARHHGDAVVVLAADRAFIAKRLVERVRIVRQTAVPEEVDRGEVLRHCYSMISVEENVILINGY